MSDGKNAPQNENEIPDGPGMATPEEEELMKAAEKLEKPRSAETPEVSEINSDPEPLFEQDDRDPDPVIPVLTAKKKFKAAENTFLLICLLAGLTVIGFLVMFCYERQMDGRIGAVVGSVEALETTIDLYSATTIRIDADVAELKGRAQASADQGERLEKRTDELAERLAKQSDELSAKIDSRAKKLTSNIFEASNAAAEAKKSAAKALEMQAARVKAENHVLRTKLGYIRQANSSSELAKLDDKEIERQLADGIWNIEGQIAVEYDRLQSNKSELAQKTAIQAAISIDAVEKKVAVVEKQADQALDAGETAASAVGIIADKPTKALGHSVGKRTKEEVKAALRSYWDKYDNRATIDAK